MTRHRMLSDPRGLTFPLVIAVLVVGFSLPVALTDHLPMQDIPNHLAIIRTLVDEDSDATWGERFENRLRLDAYATYYLAATALARHVGPEAANRIILTLYAALLPLAFLALVLAYDPGRRWSVVPAFLLVYSDLYLVGFTNYLLAMPMLFAGAAAGVRIARSDSASWPPVIALAVLGAAIYFTHPFALGMLLVVLAVLVLSPRLGLRRLIALGSALTPGLILVLRRLATTGLMPGPIFRVGLGLKIRYLATAPLFALDAHRHWSFYVAGGLGLLVAGLAVYDIVRDRRTADRSSAAPWWGDRPLIAFALFAVGYFAAPFNGANAMWFDLRLAVATWFLLLLALRPRFTRGRVRRAILVGMCAVSLLGLSGLHRGFDREIAPLFEVIEQMEPSSRVLPVVADPVSDVVQPFYTRDGSLPYYSPYAHFGAYYNVEKGGESPFMTFHAGLNWIPLGLRDPFYTEAFLIGEPFFPGVLLERLPVTASHFDYILVRGMHPDVVHWVGEFALLEARGGGFGAFAVTARQPDE